MFTPNPNELYIMPEPDQIFLGHFRGVSSIGEYL